MNYSVKRFVKKWADRTYSMQEFENLAHDLTVDSDNRYTQKSALKILVRYAKVDEAYIKLDPESRRFDQSIEKITAQLKANNPNGADNDSDSDSDCVNYDASESDNDADVCDIQPCDAKIVKSVKPVKPVETAKVVKSVKSVETAKSVKPVETAKSVKPNKTVTAKPKPTDSSSEDAEVNYDESESDSDADKSKTAKSSTTKPSTAKDTKTTAKSADKPIVKPSSTSAVKPINKPSVKSINKPSVKSTDKPSAKPSAKPTPTKAVLPVLPAKAKLSDKVVLKLNEPKARSNTSSDSSKSKSIKKTAPIDPTISPDDLNDINTPARNMNLFTMKKIGTNPTASTKSVTVQSTQSTQFGKIVKSTKPANSAKSDEPVSRTDLTSQAQDDTSIYIYPFESKPDGLHRSEELYGPYGTDNFHDDEIKDDFLGPNEKSRLKVFNYLDSIEYPAQRSKEWFALRDQMITASDGGTIVGLNPYEKPFDFIVKKVHGKPFETSIDCYHGKKYEEVATMVYEYRMNIKVKEFGLCQHPKYKILGASPDGIVCPYKLNTSAGNRLTKYVGRMLEIKCPMRRKILMDPKAPEVYGAHGEEIKDLKKDSKIGVCPSYYWVQVQLQLECCNLDECDFWQTEIWEYEDPDDFAEDSDPLYPWLSKTSKREKGALIQIMPIDKMLDTTMMMEYNDKIYNFAQFIYQPRVDMTPFEIDQWILQTLQNLKWTHKGMVFESIKYYKLIQTRNITIQRDRKWFASNLPIFQQSWAYVEYFRANKDKADLLKKYLSTFKTDYYGKIKENYKGEIMETIAKIYAEPAESKPDKEHRMYAKYIQSLRDLTDYIDDDPDPLDVADDLKEIQDRLNYESDDEMDVKTKAEHKKKYADFIKKVKKEADAYLFDD